MTIYHIKLPFFINRLITRAAIIHLQRVEGRSAEEQDYCDQTMDKAMTNAHGAAGVMNVLCDKWTYKQYLIFQLSQIIQDNITY